MKSKRQHDPNWGGKRANAGRKKVESAVEAAVRALPAAVVRPLQQPEPAADVIALARSYSTLAVKVLGIIATKGTRESARVAAATKIIEIARIREAAVDNSPPGKKAERADAAFELSSVPNEDWGADLVLPGGRVN